ncbi:uncharacterized protein FTOL_05256 [Fusarium torulosum]|uniref:Uncharacterized protein n=1 Tax=Fusarium torulosum TaxID=33205 RepID=A0AAE8SGY9_9HYPO|nr:uncharacterized protein FTOL_05256 [Fusarium torulosum]
MAIDRSPGIQTVSSQNNILLQTTSKQPKQIFKNSPKEILNKMSNARRSETRPQGSAPSLVENASRSRIRSIENWMRAMEIVKRAMVDELKGEIRFLKDECAVQQKIEALEGQRESKLGH